MTQVKICGITTAAAMDAAVEAGGDWVGVNFFPPPPRPVSPRAAAPPAPPPPRGPPRVGLFVRPSDEMLAETLAEIRLDALQLYVDAPRAAAIAARFGLPLWRPVGVGEPSDLPSAMDGAELLLIETKPPAGADRPGG